MSEVLTMVIMVDTAANGTFEKLVCDSREAVQFIRELAADGMKCIRWEVVGNVD